MSQADLIERDKQKRILAATEESNARIKGYEEEKARLNASKLEMEEAERQKKEAVLTALSEREERTKSTYANIERATKSHVDAQIAEFDRLKTSLAAVTGGVIDLPINGAIPVAVPPASPTATPGTSQTTSITVNLGGVTIHKDMDPKELGRMITSALENQSLKAR
ncbi:MAG: hypothetical protein QM775_25615 [Pirellulales bacterium]